MKTYSMLKKIRKRNSFLKANVLCRFFIVSTFILGLACATSAQLNLMRWDNCEFYTDFTKEPPEKKIRHGLDFLEVLHAHWKNILTITDSLGIHLFDVVFSYKQGRNYHDTAIIELFTSDDKKFTLKRKLGDISFFDLGIPHIAKAQGEGNIYYIFFKSNRNKGIYDNYSKLEYMRFDTDKQQIIDESPRLQADSLIGFASQANIKLKTIQYEDGSAYLFRYNGGSFMHKPKNDSLLTIYKILEDTILEIGKITNFDIHDGNLTPGWGGYPFCFYHHQKAALVTTDKGFEKISFGTESGLQRELIKPTFWNNTNNVVKIALSPNDTFLYFDLIHTTNRENDGLWQLGLAGKKELFKVNNLVTKFALAPNGKIFTNGTRVIQQPNLPYPQCKFQRFDSGYYPCNKGGIRTYSPEDNKMELNNYVWFRCQFTCTETINFLNRSDAIFEQFEWHIENLSQMSNKIYYDKNL